MIGGPPTSVKAIQRKCRILPGIAAPQPPRAKKSATTRWIQAMADARFETELNDQPPVPVPTRMRLTVEPYALVNT